jgi:acyl carrier protein
MNRVIQLITDIGGIGEITLDTAIYDAGFSSARALELVLSLEEEFGLSIPDQEFLAARTPRQIAGLVDRLHQSQTA